MTNCGCNKIPNQNVKTVPTPERKINKTVGIKIIPNLSNLPKGAPGLNQNKTSVVRSYHRVVINNKLDIKKETDDTNTIEDIAKPIVKERITDFTKIIYPNK